MKLRFLASAVLIFVAVCSCSDDSHDSASSKSSSKSASKSASKAASKDKTQKAAASTEGAAGSSEGPDAIATGTVSTKTLPSVTDETGTLPPVDDLGQLGPYTPMQTNSTGPRGEYQIFHPAELGQDGVKHPIVLFGQGGGFTDVYATLMRYLSSQGFVVLSYWLTPEADELTKGLDWLIEQANADDGTWAGKLDTEHIGAVGHSYGALGLFWIAADERISTTVHLQGGTLSPHTQVANLQRPAAFLCGESPKGSDDGIWTGDMSNPNCEADFDIAEVPVFYGSMTGAAHIQLTDAVSDPNDPLRLKMIDAIVGWLRWQIAGDSTQKKRYVGPDCDLCNPDTGWVVMQKDLE